MNNAVIQAMDNNFAVGCEYLNLDPDLAIDNIRSRRYTELKYIFIYLCKLDGIIYKDMSEYLGLSYVKVKETYHRIETRMSKEPDIKTVIEESVELRSKRDVKTSSFRTVDGLLKNGYVLTNEDKLIEFAKKYSSVMYRNDSLYTDVLRDLIYKSILT